MSLLSGGSASPRPWKLQALSAGLGLSLAVGLVLGNDGAAIFRAILDAGWGILLVIAIHPVQTVLAGLAWRFLLPSRSAPGLLEFCLLRWIREAVNALLPVAQIGGEVVGARLMCLGGVALNAAVAATAVDLTGEMVSQVAFTLCGVGLLAFGPYDPALARWVGGLTAIALVVIGAFVLAQRRWLFRWLERWLLRLAEQPRWSALGEVAGLHELVAGLYRRRWRLLASIVTHLISWLIGGVEVMVALRVVGAEVDLGEGLLIESIGQAMRTVGFAIPGSLGVQEGGYILICGLVGVGPQSAIAMSLLKRIREVVVGVPGLVAWHAIEGRQWARRLAETRPQTPTELVQ
jgi:putative membrane protein